MELSRGLGQCYQQGLMTGASMYIFARSCPLIKKQGLSCVTECSAWPLSMAIW